MKFQTSLMLAATGVLPLADALAMPHLNHMAKHFKRDLKTVTDWTTIVELVTVTDGDVIPAATSTSAAFQGAAFVESTTKNAYHQPTSSASPVPSSSSAPPPVVPSSYVQTSSTSAGGNNDYTHITTAAPQPSSTKAAATGSMTGYQDPVHRYCDGPSNTVLFTATDEVTRTVYFEPNINPLYSSLPTPSPVVVAPHDAVEVEFVCGWEGRWHSISELTQGSSYTLGEVIFQGWQYNTFYDVSAVDTKHDNVGVHWLYPTYDTTGLTQGCGNFNTKPKPAGCLYYEYDFDDAAGMKGAVQGFGVHLTQVLGKEGTSCPR